METYEPLEMEVIEFEVEDVITASEQGETPIKPMQKILSLPPI